MKRAVLVALALTGCGPAAAPPPDGPALYARHCAGCHGPEGAGDGPAAVSFDPIPRDFTTGRFAFRSTGPQQLPTDADLYQTVADGLRWSAMPPFDGEMTPAEIRAVVEHVKALSKRQNDEGEWHHHFLDHPDRRPLAIEPPPPVSQAVLEEGRDLYAFSSCINCHGPEGAGDGTSADWLVDENGTPIRPRDLRNPIYQRGASAAEIFLRIRCGIPGSPMPSLSRHVPDADAWAIAFHVRSLQTMPVDFVARGRLLYRAHGCIECHSEDLTGSPNPGAAQEWTTPMLSLAERLGLRNAAEAGTLIAALRARPDVAADPAVRKLANAVDVVQRLAATRRAIRDGVDVAWADPAVPPAFPRMPGWSSRLSDRDIDAIIAYCLTLQLWLGGDGSGTGMHGPGTGD